MVSITFLVVVLIVIMSPPLVAAAEANDHRCNSCAPYTTGCSQCGTGRCCSPDHFCGTSFGYCTEFCYCGENVCHPCNCLGNCPLDHVADQNQQQQPSVYSANRTVTYDELFLAATYEPDLVMVSSSEVRNRTSSSSAAICGPSSSSSTSNISTHSTVLGQCLLVSNRENGKRAMVRIINETYCANTSLALDYHALQQLRTSGNGGNSGGRRLPINYNYVQCIET